MSLRARAALVAALLAIAFGGAAAAQIGGISPTAFGYRTWRDPVASEAALPLSGNSVGDTRVALDQFAIYVWTGTEWVTAEGGGEGPAGPQGPPGAAATVAVGSTATGAPGSDAEVTNSGTASAAVLDFSIPRGDVGAAGATGAQGPAGPTGADGADGEDGIPRTVQDEGAALAQRLAVNFTGAGVECADNAGQDRTDCTIPGGVTDHGALAGLGDDDHAQYALLAGRSGGQTVVGGPAPTDTLTLDGSTATAGALTITGAGGLTGAPLLEAGNLRISGNSVTSLDSGGHLNIVTTGGEVRLAAPIRIAGGPGFETSGNFVRIGAIGVGGPLFGGNENDVNTGVRLSATGTVEWAAGGPATSGNDTKLAREAAGVIRLTDAVRVSPRSSPPVTCGAANTQGTVYNDDSVALCWCDGTSWQKLSGGGTCA